MPRGRREDPDGGHSAGVRQPRLIERPRGKGGDIVWRLLAALGALTFLVSGVQVLGDPDCESVTWGGRGGVSRP